MTCSIGLARCRRPPRRRHRRRDARSLPRSAASIAFRPRRRCRSCGSSATSTGSAARRTSRTTSPRSAASPALVGLVGDDDVRASSCERALRPRGPRRHGLVTDARAPDDAENAHRDVAQSAGRARGLRRRTPTSPAPRSTPLAATDRRRGRTRDAIVLSDYRKGVVTPAVDRRGRAPPRVRPACRSSSIPKCRRPSGIAARRCITPNHHEAELMTQTCDPHRTTTPARRRACCTNARGASVLITLGRARHVVLDRSAAHPSRPRCRRRRAKSPTSPAPATP